MITDEKWSYCKCGKCGIVFSDDKSVSEVCKVTIGEWGDTYPSFFVEGITSAVGDSGELSGRGIIQAVTKMIPYGNVPEQDAISRMKAISKVPEMLVFIISVSKSLYVNRDIAEKAKELLKDAGLAC